MSYSLICIDIQTQFTASQEIQFQTHCKNEIKKAMSDNAPIIFVEFSACGPTDPKVVSIVKDKKYKRSLHLVKSQNDGSRVIYDTILRRKLPKLNIKVIGVNTDYCVYETVKGLNLRLKNSKIQVVESACNSPYSHSEGILNLKALSPNVEVI